MSHGDVLLADLKSLQHRVSQRLAEKEAEVRELTGTDSRLGQLQQELDGLQPDPRRWSAERQALMDRRDELSRAITMAEARWKQTVETATENGRRLEEELEQARALVLRTQQELAHQESSYLADHAATAQRRDRLADQVMRAQQQLAAVAADKQRQDGDLAALLARVGALEEELQRVRAAEAEKRQRTPTDIQMDPQHPDEQRKELEGEAEQIHRQLTTVAALRTEQQQLSEERLALMARVAELEHASPTGTASQTADEESWKADQARLFAQLAQLEQALKVREEQSLADREQLTDNLNQAHRQLTEFSKREDQWNGLEEDRAKLQAHLGALEQSWIAREAAIAQERAQWQQQLEGVIGQQTVPSDGKPKKRGFFTLPGGFRRRRKSKP